MVVKKRSKKTRTQALATRDQAKKKKQKARDRAKKQEVVEEAPVRKALPRREDGSVDLGKIISGTGVNIFTGDQLITSQSLRRPTTVPSLNLEIGGGFGAGCLSAIYGPESSCKTWLAGQVLVKGQQIYGDTYKAAYLSFGLPFDKPYNRLHNLKLPFAEGEEEAFSSQYRALNGLPPTPEEIAEVSAKVGEIFFMVPDVSTPAVMEKVLERVLQGIQSQQFHTIIIDDIGAMTAASVNKKALWEEPKMMEFASVLTKFSQRCQASLQMSGGSFNETSVICISQVRMTKQGMFSLIGGRCFRHNCATILRVTPSGGEGSKYIDWKVEKGKYGHGEGAFGVIDFNPISGVDTLRDLVDTAVLYQVVELGGSWYKYKKLKAQGYDPFILELEKNSELQEQIWQDLKEKKGLKIRTS